MRRSIRKEKNGTGRMALATAAITRRYLAKEQTFDKFYL